MVLILPFYENREYIDLIFWSKEYNIDLIWVEKNGLHAVKAWYNFWFQNWLLDSHMYLFQNLLNLRRSIFSWIRTFEVGFISYWNCQNNHSNSNNYTDFYIVKVNLLMILWNYKKLNSESNLEPKYNFLGKDKSQKCTTILSTAFFNRMEMCF